MLISRDYVNLIDLASLFNLRNKFRPLVQIKINKTKSKSVADYGGAR